MTTSNWQTGNRQTRPRWHDIRLGENEMTDKKQRTLAHTIMSEFYGVSIGLDADLRSVYSRLASRLRLILAGTPEADGVRLPAVPAVCIDLSIR
jgi:hypothetical protein